MSARRPFSSARKIKTILVVDDNPMQIRLAKLILENEGYEVLTAKDGQEAVEMIRCFHPLAVLTDFLMPRLNGMELARQIKKEDRTRDIQVVLMSSLLPERTGEGPWEKDFDGFLLKPIDSRVLTGTIKDLLRSKTQGVSRNA